MNGSEDAEVRISDPENQEPIVVTVKYPERKTPLALWVALIWIMYFLWHMHDDIMSLQIHAQLLDDRGHLKPAIRQEIDANWRKQWGMD